MNDSVLWLAWWMAVAGALAVVAAFWQPRRPAPRCAWCERPVTGYSFRAQLYADARGSERVTLAERFCSRECIVKYATAIASGSQYAGMGNPCGAGMREGG